MMQPTLALIFYQDEQARNFRNNLFSNYQVEEIINLSTLRFGLFKDAISPASIITICVTEPSGDPLVYICPKPIHTSEDNYRLVIEPQDINQIYPHEAITKPTIWATFMWGGRRDLAFMKQLNQCQNIAKLADENSAVYTQGIIRGNRQSKHDDLLKRKIFDAEEFPNSTFLYLDTELLDINQDPYAERPRKKKTKAFDSPQLIVKQSWQIEQRRFQAALAEISNESNQRGIVCSGSYVTIHMAEDRKQVLKAACLSYNSKLATYYLLLSSSSFASYIPKANVEDLMRVPIPEPQTDILQGIETIDDLDQRVCHSFSFKDSEWLLVEDLFNYTLPDFKGDTSSPGRQSTRRLLNNSHDNIVGSELGAYCKYFLRVIKAGFGEEKQVCATIFQEPTDSYLPVRLVAIHLNQPVHEGIKIETIDSQDLLERLYRLNQIFLTQKEPEDGGIYYQRVARVYDSIDWNGLKVPTVYLIKPDKVRYWTRSMALRDADEVVADIMMSTNTPTNTPVKTA